MDHSFTPLLAVSVTHTSIKSGRGPRTFTISEVAFEEVHTGSQECLSRLELIFHTAPTPSTLPSMELSLRNHAQLTELRDMFYVPVQKATRDDGARLVPAGTKLATQTMLEARLLCELLRVTQVDIILPTSEMEPIPPRTGPVCLYHRREDCALPAASNFARHLRHSFFKIPHHLPTKLLAFSEDLEYEVPRFPEGWKCIEPPEEPETDDSGVE